MRNENSKFKGAEKKFSFEGVCMTGWATNSNYGEGEAVIIANSPESLIRAIKALFPGRANEFDPALFGEVVLVRKERINETKI